MTLKSNKNFSTGMGLSRPEIDDDVNLPADDPMRGWLRRIRQFIDVTNGVVQIKAPGSKTLKGDLFFPTWTTVTSFSNSWVNNGNAAFPDAAYSIDAFGVVRIMGVLKSGTSGAAAFTMGAAYAPHGVTAGKVLSIGSESQDASNNILAARLDITTAGALVPFGNNNLVVITCSYRGVGA